MFGLLGSVIPYVLCFVYCMSLMMMKMNAFYGSPHGAFIGQVPWVTSKGRDLLGLLHGIRSVEIPRYPEFIFAP